MTIGLIRWLRAFAPPVRLSHSRAIPHIVALRLSARDIADLNLPGNIAGLLQARAEAEELRRRILR